MDWFLHRVRDLNTVSLSLMWKSRFPNTICWTGSFHNVCIWDPCQNQVVVTVWTYFWILQSIPFVYISGLAQYHTVLLPWLCNTIQTLQVLTPLQEQKFRKPWLLSTQSPTLHLLHGTCGPQVHLARSCETISTFILSKTGKDQETPNIDPFYKEVVGCEITCYAQLCLMALGSWCLSCLADLQNAERHH